MYTCILCRFEVPYDDAVAPTPTGRCICLGCYLRHTDTNLRMAKGLRRELESALGA
jgi:hypothetical protein